jgi:cellobiose transport system permease protein
MSATTVREAALAAPQPSPGRARRYRAPDAAGPLTYVLLVVTALIFIVPFYYMIVAASRPMAEMNQSPPPFLPGPDLWQNITIAVQQQAIGLSIVNSLIVSGVTTIGTLCSAPWPGSRSRSCGSAARTRCSPSPSAP